MLKHYDIWIKIMFKVHHKYREIYRKYWINVKYREIYKKNIGNHFSKIL